MSTEVKLCKTCKTVFEKRFFMEGRATCRACYKLKYKKKQEETKILKDIEKKNIIINGYSDIVKENEELKKEIEHLKYLKSIEDKLIAIEEKNKKLELCVNNILELVNESKKTHSNV